MMNGCSGPTAEHPTAGTVSQRRQARCSISRRSNSLALTRKVRYRRDGVKKNNLDNLFVGILLMFGSSGCGGGGRR